MKIKIARAAILSSAAFILALGALPAAAQAPKVDSKVVLENDKVQVLENRFKPGAENPNVPRTARVVRALTSGTLQRIYPDGKRETVEFKAGDTRFNAAITGPAPQYTTKNIGKTELVLLIVVLK